MDSKTYHSILTDSQAAAQIERDRKRFFGTGLFGRHPDYNMGVLSLIDPDERYRNKSYQTRFTTEEEL